MSSASCMRSGTVDRKSLQIVVGLGRTWIRNRVPISMREGENSVSPF